MTELKEIFFSKIDERIYSTRLENGLNVFLIPKQGFQESYGVMIVNFGSLDTNFTQNGQFRKYNAGIAHFLEHKLFELENHQDVSELFTNLGAESNAFTTFDKTCYYFSAVNHLEENLTLLQQFITVPSFSEISVSREKNIIGQEIAMYQDDADYCLYQGILENLYPNTVLAQDIAGTQESIEKISVEDLKENHSIFYVPQKMTLLLVGDFDKTKIFNHIKTIQKTNIRKSPAIKRQALTYHQVIPKKSIQMKVTQPKLAVGYRGEQPSKEISILRQELALKLFFAMLLGWTSQYYQHFYEKGQFDDSFDFEIEVYPDFQFLIISLDTFSPIATANIIRQHLNNVSQLNDLDDLTKEHFEMVKKELYGDFFNSLDSIDELSEHFIRYLSDKETYLDIPDILETLQFEDVLQIGHYFLAHTDVTEFTILPK